MRNTYRYLQFRYGRVPVCFYDGPSTVRLSEVRPETHHGHKKRVPLDRYFSRDVPAKSNGYRRQQDFALPGGNGVDSIEK